MKSLLPILAFALPLVSEAQDMAVAAKWEKAKVIKYQVEGVHKARASVVMNSMEAKGDVTDRITVVYTWDVKNRKMIGAPTVTDGATEVTNLKSEGTNCGPPQLDGPYEHFKSTSSGMVGGLFEVKGTRTYPPAKVSNFPASCSMSAVKGGTENVVLHVGTGIEPTALAMPHMPGPVTIAQDRKSFSMKGAGNWVWTYTPTLVQ